MSDAISYIFNGTQRTAPRRALLGGDSLEIVGFDPSRPIYFDHDLNGTKEGTGWVKSDDGFLDRNGNGNGVIDNGSELFGGYTPLSGAGHAADSFAALVQEDTNADGKRDALDARIPNLRVWRDLNQGGISQASELTILTGANNYSDGLTGNGGAGKDMILSATGLNLAPQKDRNNDGILDDWAPPAGAGAVWTSGRLRGIYADNDGSETVDGGGPESQDSAGDIVFAGDDNDKVISRLGDNYLDGGRSVDHEWRQAA